VEAGSAGGLEGREGERHECWGFGSVAGFEWLGEVCRGGLG